MTPFRAAPVNELMRRWTYLGKVKCAVRRGLDEMRKAFLTHNSIVITKKRMLKPQPYLRPKLLFFLLSQVLLHFPFMFSATRTLFKSKISSHNEENDTKLNKHLSRFYLPGLTNSCCVSYSLLAWWNRYRTGNISALFTVDSTLVKKITNTRRRQALLSSIFAIFKNNEENTNKCHLSLAII